MLDLLGEKARTGDGGSERSQAPRIRDVETPKLLSNELTPSLISFSDLPFDGESLGFDTKWEKHRQLWEEERRRAEEDRLLRSLAEEILHQREEERKAKRRDEDFQVEERLRQKRVEAEEEERQTKDKERQLAREFWRVHSAKRFRFTCRRGAFTPIRTCKGSLPPRVERQKKKRSPGRKKYEKLRLKQRRAANLLTPVFQQIQKPYQFA
ncbi:hypothetical protein GG344DRAFT_67074 [Lentinula edodes]|nr:hypothetical protein GG344DRAFT_67074 [Lentinula edodes]